MNAKLIYYDHQTKQLTGSIKEKARRLAKLGLVEVQDRDTWRIKPIKGYNKREYTVKNNYDGWTCNCQFWQKSGRCCSHILAVSYYMRRLHEDR